MRKNLLFSVAFAALALAACNKQEPDAPGTGGVVEGQPAMMQVSLTQNVGTYASPDADAPATDGEKEITSAVVYVFNAQNTLEAMQTMTSATSSAFPVTSGSKKVFVAVNFAPATAATSFTPTVGSTLSSQFEAALLESLNLTQDDAKNYAQSGKMWMTSFKDNVADGGLYDEIVVPTTATESSPHKATVTVGRLSAKVVLNLNSSNSGVLNATIDPDVSPQWNVMNIPVKSNLVGQYKGGILQTPLRSDATESNYFDTQLKDVDAYNADWGGTSNSYSPVYVTENSRAKESILYGNTTLARIAIKWTPTVIYDGNTDEETTYTDDTDFYVIVANDGTVLNDRLYASKPTDNIVQDYVSNGTQANNVKTYTGGIGYYFVPVRDLADTDLDRSFSVERNHLYRIHVSKINSVGDPDGKPDPDTPIVTSSAMDVTITVSPWVVKDINTEI